MEEHEEEGNKAEKARKEVEENVMKQSIYIAPIQCIYSEVLSVLAYIVLSVILKKYVQ